MKKTFKKGDELNNNKKEILEHEYPSDLITEYATAGFLYIIAI
jgi:hypothetical protein